MAGRFEYQRGTLKLIACIAAFLGTVVAPAIRLDCGSIDSATVFDTLTSCNGDYVFSRQDGNMVLLHKPSGRKIWQSTEIDGAYFAFYDPDNQPIAFSSPGDTTQTLQANSAPLDINKPSDESDAAHLTPLSGENQEPSPGASLFGVVSNQAGSLPVQFGKTPDFTQPIGTPISSLPALDGKNPSDNDLKLPYNVDPIGTQPETSNTEPFQVSVSPDDSNGGVSLPDLHSGTAIADLKARAILQNTPFSNSQFSGRLELADNGNLEIYRKTGDTTETRAWESKTDGVECRPAKSCKGGCPLKLHLTNIEIGVISNHMQERGYNSQAGYIQKDVCALFRPKFNEIGIRDIKEDSLSLAGHANSLSLAGRAIKQHSNTSEIDKRYFKFRNVVLEHEMAVTFYLTEASQISQTLIVGTMRLQKVFCYDGFKVMNCEGKTPDPAALTGDPVDWAGWGGLIYSGQAPGSNLDVFSPATGANHDVVNGKEGGTYAHVSKREARFEWKLPLINAYINVDSYFSTIMYIKVLADGSAICRGGADCILIPET